MNMRLALALVLVIVLCFLRLLLLLPLLLFSVRHDIISTYVFVQSITTSEDSHSLHHPASSKRITDYHRLSTARLPPCVLE